MAGKTLYQDYSNEELEQLLRHGKPNLTDIDVDYDAARAEFEFRRNKRLFTHQQRVFDLQEKLYLTAQTRLDRIIKLLDKPVWLALIASGGALLIGIAINVLTSFVCAKLHCPK